MMSTSDTASLGVSARRNPSTGPRVVALGGGHGLSATLRALRQITDHLTAVVTVGDDGGSSGVLRRDLDVIPVGDLRMALAAMAADGADTSLWADALQHRFDRGDLQGHPVGNLLLVALIDLMGDPVRALDRAGELLGVVGRVLPMCRTGVDIVAEVERVPDEVSIVRGQVAVATTTGRVIRIGIEPAEPEVPHEVLDAVQHADAIVLGPGSWFTSVLPHLVVPKLRDAIATSAAQRIVTMNLAPQPGETGGYEVHDYLHALVQHAPGVSIDRIVADPQGVTQGDALDAAASQLGATVDLLPVASSTPGVHDVAALASAYDKILTSERVA